MNSKFIVTKKVIILFALLISISSIVSAQQNISTDFHDWAPTPPLGWNSWDCYGPNVTEGEVKANADFLAAHLKQYGWEYIVVDIRWYVANDKSHGYNETDPQYNIDSFGRFIPAVNRFPSSADGKGFKPLADYLHSKGLKLGIHIMRGVPVIAVKNKMPVYGTNKTATDIYSDSMQCPWLHDMFTVDASKDGAQQYYNSIINLYAGWGVDFIKCDDLSRPYHKAEIEMLRKAIDNCGRKIVLSMSPGETPIAEGKHAMMHANLWRTIDDFWDNWPELKAHFDIFKRWNQYRTAGAYPDGDMLPLGHLGIKAERGNDRQSLFTKDEQYTLMTLWSIFRSPLMFGGDLPTSNEFAISLLTNKDVIQVLQNSINNKELFRDGDIIAWTATDAGKKLIYLALFNTGDSAKQVNFSFQSRLGLTGKHAIKNLWTGILIKNVDAIKTSINAHGALLYSIQR
ncbi:MAG: glycoside hydrolase family 27 protein [Bacteroidetes bacterium]|nr:glycoside hydrolase family 27 protein [Bacteroidota bacterium]